MKRILIVLAALVAGGFAYLAVSQAINVKETQKLNNFQIESKQLERNKLELDLKKLNTDLKEQLEKKTLDQQKIEELDQKINDAQEREQELNRQLQAKLHKKQQDAQRLATASKRATGTNTAYAAESGCEGIRKRLAALGVVGSELDAAITLAMRESTCREHVVNSIGACGAFQSLPCGKWGATGTDEYYKGAIKYARDRYGSYNAALSHSYAKNWY